MAQNTNIPVPHKAQNKTPWCNIVRVVHINSLPVTIIFCVNSSYAVLKQSVKKFITVEQMKSEMLECICDAKYLDQLVSVKVYSAVGSGAVSLFLTLFMDNKMLI